MPLRNKSAAFTLVELLIVVLIITITTSVALWALGDFGEGRKTRQVMMNLKNTLSFAVNRSLWTQQIVGVRIDPKQWSFYKLMYKPNSTKMIWVPLHIPPMLVTTDLEGRIHLQTTCHENTLYSNKEENSEESSEEQLTPQIMIHEGHITPCKIIVSIRDQRAAQTRYTLTLDQTIRLSEGP